MAQLSLCAVINKIAKEAQYRSFGCSEELGEIELKVKLEEMAADQSRHARELRRLLKGMWKKNLLL